MKTLVEKVNDLEHQLSAQWNSKVALSSKLTARYKELEKQLETEREANESLQKQVHSLEAKVGWHTRDELTFLSLPSSFPIATAAECP